MRTRRTRILVVVCLNCHIRRSTQTACLSDTDNSSPEYAKKIKLQQSQHVLNAYY